MSFLDFPVIFSVGIIWYGLLIFWGSYLRNPIEFKKKVIVIVVEWLEWRFFDQFHPLLFLNYTPQNKHGTWK